MGAAVGLANLEIMESENLVANAAEVGPYFKRCLEERVGDHPMSAISAAWASFSASSMSLSPGSKAAPDMTPPAHRRISAAAQERGLLTRGLPFLPVNAFSPPLTFTRANVDETVGIYGEAVESVFGKG